MAAMNDSAESLPQTPSAKLAQAALLKEKGTEHFKNEEWREAAKCYHHSLMYCKGVTSGLPSGDPFMRMVLSQRQGSTLDPTDDEKAEAKRLTITLSNNIAVCMLKLEKWDKVIKHCSTVLNEDARNVKALYRRGVAHLNLGMLDESEVDLKIALEIDPNDSSVKRQYAILQESQKLYWNSEKQKYKKLFES